MNISNNIEKAIAIGLGITIPTVSIYGIYSYIYSAQKHNKYEELLNFYGSMKYITNRFHPKSALSPEEDIAVAQCLASDNINQTIPPTIISRCQDYVGLLPPYLDSFIKDALSHMEITYPIFFYETTNVSHAMTAPFNAVGLHRKTFFVFDPEHQHLFSDTNDIYKERFVNGFYATLYHELSHIKENHNKPLIDLITEKTSKLEFLRKQHGVDVSKELNKLLDPPKNVIKMYSLYKEMFADLSATFYLKKDLNICNMDNNKHRINDEHHPSHLALSLHMKLLLKHLNNKPHSNFDIVHKLSQRYAIIYLDPWFKTFLEV